MRGRNCRRAGGTRSKLCAHGVLLIVCLFHRRRTGRTRLRLVASNYRPEKIVFCESVSVSMPRRARGDHFHADQVVVTT